MDNKITHGLPYPENLQLARDMESEVRQQNAVPATVGVVDGRIYVGLDESQHEHLATGQGMVKVSVRDFAPAMVGGRSGGTTVAGTLLAANLAGLKVFATGGIGGVHRNAPFDVSTDLIGLSRTPLVVVCAGAKAILDIPATLEVLETYGVPVIGYQTDDFPAFYSRSSGLPVSARVDSPEQVAQIAQAHWGLGLPSAVLVCVPPPEEVALPIEAVAGAIDQALAEAQAAGIHGQAVTPFLLQRVGELTHGNSLRTNLALLRNNARVAAQIAQYLR
ncbi:MAG: pseudouridine-5'-phosphate glycosidase [Anaerolineales bacterium]|nr:pseudouridine-5'-phosphate glycosidase [Anaerolineales bacterium]